MSGDNREVWRGFAKIKKLYATISLMIQAARDNHHSFYGQIQGLANLREGYARSHSLGSNLNEFVRQAKALHDMLFTFEETIERGGAESYSHPGSRAYNVTTCEPTFLELGHELNEIIVHKALDNRGWVSFVDLLQTLDTLIGLRLGLSPKRQDRSLRLGNQDFIQQCSKPVNEAIEILAETIQLWTSNLSAQAKDFIEHHINNTDSHLDQLKKAYNQKFPIFSANFKTLLGFDKNADGSARTKIQTKKPAAVANRSTMNLLFSATWIKGNRYWITDLTDSKRAKMPGVLISENGGVGLFSFTSTDKNGVKTEVQTRIVPDKMPKQQRKLRPSK